MEQLRSSFDDQFVTDLRKRFEESIPYVLRGLSKEEIELRIRFGIKKARSFGIRGRNDLTDFVNWMFTISPKFYEHPVAYAILTSKLVEDNRRVYSLTKEITEEQAEQMCEADSSRLWRQIMSD